MAHKGSPFAVASDDAASASLPGTLSVADFNKLASVPAGNEIQGTYISAEIDLTATGTFTIAPAVTSKYFCCHRILVLQTDVQGAFTSAATIRIGNNATPTNVFAASTLLTNTTAFALGTGCLTGSAVTQAVQVISAATVCEVTIAAVGAGMVWKVKVMLIGNYNG